MSPDGAFFTSLGVTLLVLAGVVVTGFRARRRVHLTLVGATVLLLAVTIWCAERLGDHYDLQAAGAITPVHLTLAKVTTAAFLLPIFTGVRTLRRPDLRVWHRRAAFLVLALSVLTFGTGMWMISAAERLR